MLEGNVPPSLKSKPNQQGPPNLRNLPPVQLDPRKWIEYNAVFDVTETHLNYSPHTVHQFYKTTHPKRACQRFISMVDNNQRLKSSFFNHAQARTRRFESEMASLVDIPSSQERQSQPYPYKPHSVKAVANTSIARPPLSDPSPLPQNPLRKRRKNKHRQAPPPRSSLSPTSEQAILTNEHSLAIFPLLLVWSFYCTMNHK